MTLKVEYSLAAEYDLRAIFNWVADASDADTAQNYLQRVRSRCDSLASFPQRGTRRADVAPDLRTVPFERRALIAYVIEGESVRILRVLHKGLDIQREFPS